MRTQRSGPEPGTSGQHLVPSRVQARDRRARGHAGVVGERDVDARGRPARRPGTAHRGRAHARSRPPPAGSCPRARAGARAGSWSRAPSPRRSTSSTRRRRPPAASWSVSADQPQAPVRDRTHAPRRVQHSVHRRSRRTSGDVARARPAPAPRRRSSPARARAARRCRWPAAAGPARPSRACSGARGRRAARRRPPGVPAALASRQVTPPVECTSTSAAASSSGMRSVKPYTCTRGSPAKLAAKPARQLLVAAGQADDACSPPAP